MPVTETQNYKEEKAIEELQMRMEKAFPEALCDDEFIYYRFLKARDFDVDKAEKMLRKHISWRKVNQVDTILKDFKPTEFFRKYPEPSLIGFDKDGDIVKYSPAGKLNPHDIMKCMTNYYYMKHWFWFAESSISSLNKENEKTGRKSYTGTAILDLDKLTFTTATSRVTAEMLLQFVNVYQDNYPERMKNLFLINAPPYYVIIFSILKTVMSNAMISKIHIFGSSGWKEKLLEAIDADVLPAFLGGNRTDPDGDPLCRTFISHGGKIPESYFSSGKDRYFKDVIEVKMATIQPMEKKAIHVEVTNVGSLIEWEFFVKGKDIGFELLFQALDERKMVAVIPVVKYTTSDGTVKDSYKCRSAGRYTVVFDNSYSWMNTKEVQYCITVMEPIL